MDNIFVWVVIIAIVLWVISKRNEFEELRQDINRARSEIRVYEKKRESSLKDALSIAKRAYDNEVSGIERMTANDQFDQLLALTEKYPVLQSIPAYSTAMNNSLNLNNELTASRTSLNGNINEYNKDINSFPGLIIAKIFGYKAEKLIDEEHLAETGHLNISEVDFSQF